MSTSINIFAIPTEWQPLHETPTEAFPKWSQSYIAFVIRKGLHRDLFRKKSWKNSNPHIASGTCACIKIQISDPDELQIYKDTCVAQTVASNFSRRGNIMLYNNDKR